MTAPQILDKEILGFFREESNQVLDELEAVVESIEIESVTGKFPTMLLADFSQKIDRIMGAAKTMSLEAPDHQGFQRMGKLAELCKILGYKAAEKQAVQFLPLFAAFWADTIEVTRSLLDAIEDSEKTAEISKSFPTVLQKRLEWLAARLEPQSAGSGASHESKANEIKDLLKSLGL